MGIAVSFGLPLAGLAMLADAPLDMPVDPGAESARFANVLVTSYVCEHLGYSVDYAGLSDWGDRVIEDLVAAGVAPKDAMIRIRSDVRRERDNFNERHGNAVWQTGLLMTGVDQGTDAQYRFQKTFTDRCNMLARSSDAGVYFGAPESRLSGADLSRKTRALIIKARAGD